MNMETMYQHQHPHQQPQTTKKPRWKTVAFRLLVAVLILWTLLASGYVVYDQLLKFQNRQLQSGYQTGVADSIRTIMAQSENCQRVVLHDGDKRLELIDVTCQN